MRIIDFIKHADPSDYLLDLEFLVLGLNADGRLPSDSPIRIKIEQIKQRLNKGRIKRQKIKEAKLKKEYEEEMKGEKFQASNNVLLLYLKDSKEYFVPQMARAAEQVGKATQLEMKKRKEDHLTKDALVAGIKRVCECDERYDDCVRSAKGTVLTILMATWKHGQEVGKVLGYEGEKFDNYMEEFKSKYISKQEKDDKDKNLSIQKAVDNGKQYA